MDSLLTEEYKKYIVDNYAKQTNKELLDNLKTLGYKGGMTTIRNFRYANDLRKPKEGCFCKEYERTWWIGKTKDKYPELWNTETRLNGYEKLKGNVPVNKKPVGTIYDWKNKNKRLNRYKLIRTEQGLKMYHQYLWEENFGPIPEGYCVKFMDNNPKNCTLENLKLCKREAMVMGMSIGFTNDPELNEEVLKIAELKGVIKDVRNNNRQKHRRND